MMQGTLIVEPSDERRLAAECARCASAVREASVQLEKADRRAAHHRTEHKRRCVELGRALVNAHDALGIRQGDRSGRWAVLLESAGLDPETARRYMRLGETSLAGFEESEVTYRDLGLDNRPRKSELVERDAKPDNAPPPATRTGGRGKP